MIPRRIALAGFLSYRDEQVFDFDGPPISLLIGPNGSGKSSVFDAVTYALYGAHRGGKQGAEELITKGKDALRVEFDFEVAGALYRVQRTAKRKGNPTRQVSRHLPGEADPDRRWQPEPDTHLEAGFEDWVREHVGLTYEAFTSSVLLLQGRAEKLISAKPADRLIVLKEIVGIDRFERLHLRVADHARGLARRVEDARDRLLGVPAVEDAELANALAAQVEADVARTSAGRELERRIGLEHQAIEAERLRAEIDGLLSWLDRARGMIAESGAIQAALARLAELREVVPHLATVIEHRRRLAEADAASARSEARRRLLETESRAADEARRDLRARLDDLNAAIPDAEKAVESLRERLAESLLLAERARRAERRASQVAELAAKLDAYPPGLEPRAAALALEVDRLDGIDRALPSLTRLARARDDLRRAEDASRSTRAAILDAEAAVTRARADLDACDARLAEAARASEEAESVATAARVARASAVRLRNELDTLDGQAACDRCGQPLTPEHLDDERARRDAEVRSASEQHQSASASAEAARKSADSARSDHDSARRRLDDSTTRLTTLTHRAEGHARDVERSSRDCSLAFEELSVAFRARVCQQADALAASVPDPARGRTARGRRSGPAASEPREARFGNGRPIDWLATNFPDPDELKAFVREASGLAEARRRLDEAKDLLRKQTALVEKLDEARRALAEESAGLPADLSETHREYERGNVEARELKSRLDALRVEKERAAADLDRLRTEQDARHRQVVEIAQEVAGAAGRREGVRAALDRARQALPEPWRSRADEVSPAEVEARKEELDALERDGIEARFDRLRQALAESNARRDRLAELERQRDALPEEARRPLEELRDRLAEARAERDRLDRLRLDAEREADRLRQQRARRAELESEALAIEKERATAEALSDLLGPRNLQRHLVREAEEGILRFADDLLDRLSGGQLTLRLRKLEEDAKVDKALDLEVFNRESKQAISVAFLSGSQRFRVAVSLALGIGRYAGRLHRPIESVIIDEGFGCLDREGRQVMIREIRNLREHVRRIILVSHQEEFAESFSDGYALELREGTTIATRFSN